MQVTTCCAILQSRKHASTVWGVKAAIQIGKEWKTTLRRMAKQQHVPARTASAASLRVQCYGIGWRDDKGVLHVRERTYSTRAAAEKTLRSSVEHMRTLGVTDAAYFLVQLTPLPHGEAQPR